MPLVDISNSQLNSQELESGSKKRNHEEFVEPPTISEIPADTTQCLNPGLGAGSPAKSSPGLTASGSSPLEGNTPSPNVTPKRPASELLADDPKSTKLTTGEPPAKKKRTKLSGQEKAAKAAAEEQKRKEKEAAKEEKEAEKEAQKAEKEAQKAEREALKAEKEAEKEALKAKKADEAAKKAEEAAKKKREKEEAKARKLGLVGQKKLTDMFAAKSPVTPKKSAPIMIDRIEDASPAGAAASPARENDSYRKRFQPFFVKQDVTLARFPHEMDEATREVKSRILCDYLEGNRQAEAVPLAAMSNNEFLDLLQIPCRRRRGRVYPSVRKIMAGYQGDAASNVIDLTSDSQRSRQNFHTLEALKAVPVKSLKFREDVRPPYIGTVSGLPPGLKSLKAIARHPTAKITTLNYDYDSEAEWQEDDGEDVEDLDDEEEDADVDEEMEDFLDDSEDIGPARLVFSGGMEPESTGLCWENRNLVNQPTTLRNFRMEFILETQPHCHSVDPFSCSYWEPEPKVETAKPKTTSASPSTKPTNAPTAPANALQALTQAAAAKKAACTKKPEGLPADLHAKLKQFMKDHPTIGKVGLVDFFASEHQGCTKVAVKASFDMLVVPPEKTGRGKKVHWQLKDD